MGDWDQHRTDSNNDDKHRRLMEAHAKRQEIDNTWVTADRRPSCTREHAAVSEDDKVLAWSVKIWGLGYLTMRAHLDRPEDGPPGACEVTLALTGKDPI